MNPRQKECPGCASTSHEGSPAGIAQLLALLAVQSSAACSAALHLGMAECPLL